MSRSTFRPLLAWLLLCLLRAPLPEAWLVAWHSHPPTTTEPAFMARPRAVGKLLFTARHQHCHAEQLYNVPFAPAVCMAVPTPVFGLAYVPASVHPRLALRPKGLTWRGWLAG